MSTQVNPVATGKQPDFSDAPGSDLTFDQLFPSEPRVGDAPNTVTPATSAPVTTAPVTTPVPQSTPAVTPADDFFLSGSESKYRTREAAIEGINQKDAVIQQLRQRYALTTGIDPITQQPVGAAAATPASTNYARDRQRFVSDQAAALQKGDADAYGRVLEKFVMDTLEPYAPALQASARERALRQVESDVKDFDKFLGSSNYKSTLERHPELGDAIAIAESDIRFNSRLPGLYKLAYEASLSSQLPELLKANQTTTPEVRTAPVTMTPTTTAPPPSATTPAAAPSLATKEGRRAIIEAAERSGLTNKLF